MTPTHPEALPVRSAIRHHLRPLDADDAPLRDLEGVRDAELAEAQEAVEQSLSALRTALALMSSRHQGCGDDATPLALEKEFVALSMRLQDVLELARVRLDDGAVHRVPLMIDQTVRAAIDDAASSLRAHGVRVDVQTQTDVAVNGDADRIREIALRFLDLGVRATPGHVQLQVRASEGRAHVDLHAAGLAEAISGSVGLRVCRTLATAQGGRLDGPTQDRLSFSLPLRVGRRGLPAGLVDARFL